MRTKWMRLGVGELADVLRWAGAQDARRLDGFRHRVIHGREFVSFRLVPRYRVEIGSRDIIVVAHVQASARQKVGATLARVWRWSLHRIAAALATLKPPPAPAPAHRVVLYRLAGSGR